MSFIEWKRSYQHDRVCRNENNVQRWLTQHNEKMIPPLKGKGWVCQKREGKLYMTRYKLFLTITGFKKKYELDILSMGTIAKIIQNAYFNIFGNMCAIRDQHTRIMEYPHGSIRIQKYSIWATVDPRWKEERSGRKISRFLKNCYKEKRRSSITSIKQIDCRKLHLKSNIRRIVTEEEVKKCITENLERTMHQTNKEAHADWSSTRHHSKIVQYFVQNKPKNVEKPRLMLIFGLPGSGKNWVLEKKRGQHHVIINVDDCRALLPNYWKNIIEKNEDSGDWVRLFHSECAVIAQRIFEYAIEHRMNIVWNGTGKNLNKYRKLMAEAKSKGYTTELRYIWVPFALALDRVHRRASMIGRTVPKKVLEYANKQIPETFKRLRIETDYARIYSNMVISPAMIWDKDQGWHDYTPRRRKSISETVLNSNSKLPAN